MSEHDVRQIESELSELQRWVGGLGGIDQRLESLEEIKIGERIAAIEAVATRLAKMVGRIIGVLEQARHGDAAERAEPASHDADAAPELTEEP